MKNLLIAPLCLYLLIFTNNISIKAQNYDPRCHHCVSWTIDTNRRDTFKLVATINHACELYSFIEHADSHLNSTIIFKSENCKDTINSQIFIETGRLINTYDKEVGYMTYYYNDKVTLKFPVTFKVNCKYELAIWARICDGTGCFTCPSKFDRVRIHFD